MVYSTAGNCGWEGWSFRTEPEDCSQKQQVGWSKRVTGIQSGFNITKTSSGLNDVHTARLMLGCGRQGASLMYSLVLHVAGPGSVGCRVSTGT